MKEYDSAFIETILAMASETRKQKQKMERLSGRSFLFKKNIPKIEKSALLFQKCIVYYTHKKGTEVPVK